MAALVQASVTCAATGPVRIKDVKRISGPEGGEVFSEQKGLNFFQNKVCHRYTARDARRIPPAVAEIEHLQRDV